MARTGTLASDTNLPMMYDFAKSASHRNGAQS
jgi:hypothetical protein